MNQQAETFFNQSKEIGQDLYLFIIKNIPKHTVSGFCIIRFGLAFKGQNGLIKIFKTAPDDSQYTLQLYKGKIPKVYQCKKPELINLLCAA